MTDVQKAKHLRELVNEVQKLTTELIDKKFDVFIQIKRGAGQSFICNIDKTIVERY